MEKSLEQTMLKCVAMVHFSLNRFVVRFFCFNFANRSADIRKRYEYGNREETFTPLRLSPTAFISESTQPNSLQPATMPILRVRKCPLAAGEENRTL